MHIVITGATGNVGTALVRALVADPQVESIVGLARRRPRWQPPKTRWIEADVARDDLRPHLEGADAVVHLAWLIQPSRAPAITEAVNVDGSRRVFDATVDAGVPALIHASSVAAYSPTTPDQPVDEAWPTDGIGSSYYSRQKVAVERILDDVEAAHPTLRVARARPGLIFQRDAASEIRRYFAGPLMPGRLAHPRLIPFVPQLEGVAGQVVHADDVAQLYRLLCVSDQAEGAYNVAADPPLDAAALGHLLGARPLPLPFGAVRGVVRASWRARLHPVSPDWLDIAANVPVMVTDRARHELGWRPGHDPGDVVLELLAGLRARAGFATPPLRPYAGGRWRFREFATGMGGPNPLDRQSASPAASDPQRTAQR